MMRTRHTFVRWSILIVLAVLAMAGCSTATTTAGSRPVTSGTTSSRAPATNGLEHKTPAQVQQAAIDALRAASSFRIVGTMGVIDPSKPSPFDSRIQGFSSDTTTIIDGGHLEFLLANGTLYFKADRKGNQVMGIPSELLDQVSDKWIKSNVVPGMSTTVGYSVDTVIAWLRHDPTSLMATVEQDTVNGKPVVVITTKQDDRLYVADTGTPYPVRIVTTATGPIDFSQFGANFHITAPQDTVPGTFG